MKILKKLFLLVAVLSFAATAPAQAKDSLVLDGSTTVGPIAKSFAAYFTKNYGVQVTVSESGSGNGAKSLINGACDIANMSRGMKDAEVAAAKSKGVDPVAHVVALDGIAVVVHPSNFVSALTTEQIRDIYRGKVTNWNQVGGPSAKIVVIQRESNSGTQDLFRSLVVGKKNPITKRAETQASNGAVKSRVATTPAAIGFIGLGFVDDSVKSLSVDGVKPSVETVKDGSYPVARPLFMVTDGQPTGNVKKFIELNRTEDGKQMISELGYVNKY
ncbi:phosphate ABC transporter substrate-binding protein [Prosthecochloris sp. ZM_2]|uniref:phosphate ABC transporter substrate-binding protein n=1 Tax=Prosthecochloris sp. ZM_2 TaxID=2045206 RepID=UPI000DF7DE86|nr:phosphate ABC transporter substrate-binding protein [Prosthecochloris sp. ZM_2]RNA65855.1 phosphate ABC transporter substrate-binding protein [Prosthecochloris sp. ZM_2]